MKGLVVIFLFAFASARISDDQCKNYKKISENESSLIKQFPHMGLLAYESQTGNFAYNCPATLISDSFALAPAYCLTSAQGLPNKILLGTDNSKKRDDNSKLLDIVESIIHPSYSTAKPLRHSHSIALIKFSPPITPGDYIRPGCLYTKPVSDEKKLIDLLWGKKKERTLFKADSSIVPIDICQKKYETKAEINENSHLCLNRILGNNYHPNIGGTSHINDDGILKIVSLDNFGPRTPTDKIPDVSTNIYNYLDWIEDNVWKK